MFAKIKQIFNPKNRDLVKRILFTLAALFVFKIGTTIAVPILNTNKAAKVNKIRLNKSRFFELNICLIRANILNHLGFSTF